MPFPCFMFITNFALRDTILSEINRKFFCLIFRHISRTMSRRYTISLFALGSIPGKKCTHIVC